MKTTRTQSVSAIREPVACGKHHVQNGREPCQMGWYRWIASQCNSLSVLDVGAGLCEGIKVLRAGGAQRVAGFDVDEQLTALDADLRIGDRPANCYDEKSFDVITCLDVIEHVVNDVALFNELRQIARQRIYISTPNFDRSGAKNAYHCRELTISQFCNAFMPSRLYVASPDGHYHMTLLLERINDEYVDRSFEGPDNAIKTTTYPRYPIGKIPEDVKFNHTVDGEVWAHMCGVFYL